LPKGHPAVTARDGCAPRTCLLHPTCASCWNSPRSLGLVVPVRSGLVLGCAGGVLAHGVGGDSAGHGGGVGQADDQASSLSSASKRCHIMRRDTVVL
jgi:hypothetical protein